MEEARVAVPSFPSEMIQKEEGPAKLLHVLRTLHWSSWSFETLAPVDTRYVSYPFG